MSDQNKTENADSKAVECSGLLPCPFCGYDPKIEIIEQGPGNPEYWIECPSDRCTANPGLGDSSRVMAIERWNTRAR